MKRSISIELGGGTIFFLGFCVICLCCTYRMKVVADMAKANFYLNKEGNWVKNSPSNLYETTK
jgi:hypothetical protein